MKLTILFDSPYWVGVLEETRDGMLFAARIVFGAQPSDEQIYTFVLTDLDDLRDQMTVGVAAKMTARRRMNPKRAQREIRRELAQRGVSSKAHEAMRRQRESNKRERQQVTREERDAQREHKRRTRREKARKKHRGR